MNNLILRVSFEDHGDDAAGQRIVYSLDAWVKVLTQELLLLLRVTKLAQLLDCNLLLAHLWLLLWHGHGGRCLGRGAAECREGALVHDDGLLLLVLLVSRSSALELLRSVVLRPVVGLVLSLRASNKLY